MVVAHNRRNTWTRPLRSVGIGWEDMILPDVQDQRNCVDSRNLRPSNWDQKLGKIDCVLSLYDKMRWKWDDIYRFRGLPNIYSPSVCPPPLPYPVSSYTCRRYIEMYLEAMIERVWKCTWWLRSSERREALGGRDRVNSEMHLEAVIKRVGRYTWRPWSITIGVVLGGSWSGGDWSEGGQSERSQSGGSESGGSEFGGGRSGGMCDGSWDSIHWLTRNCGNVENWVQLGPLRTGRLAGSGRQSISGWCSTRCILDSVLTHDHGMER